MTTTSEPRCAGRQGGPGLNRLVRRLFAGLTESAEELDAAELAVRVRDTGCVRLADASRGDRVTVTGRIRSVTSGGTEGFPGVTAELFDGSGELAVCWLGRRSLAGIDTGRFLRISGRVGLRDGRKIMFNPRYDLVMSGRYNCAEETDVRI